MTFSLTKVLTTLLAIAQFSNKSPDIVRIYDPAKKEVIAADLGKGCRAMFSDDKFFTAKEIDEIVAQLRVQAEAQKKTELEQEKEKAAMATDTASGPQIVNPNKVDRLDISDSGAPADGDDEVSDAGDPTNGETSAPTNDNFAQMLNGLKLFKDLSFSQALDIWDGVCRDKIDINKVAFIDWNGLATQYNTAVRDLPDYKFLKGYKLPQTNFIYDSQGKFLREIYSAEARRTWIALKDIPEHVKQAFISAEDQNFRSHQGIEPRGVLRGFMKFMRSNKVEGGSTITQQVIKNLVVGSDLSLDRKIKEMLLAKLVEHHLNKEEILEIYLNLINLGRSSWGVEMAARNYFGKSAKDLSVGEAAFIAGVTHAPNRYEPSLHMDKVNVRKKFVVARMLEDKAITQQAADETLGTELKFIARKKEKGSNYYISAVNAHMREKLGNNLIKKGGLKVRTSMNAGMQSLVQASLQEGLFEYEVKSGRTRWSGPVANLKINPEDTKTWSEQLTQLKNTYSDMSWNLAVVLDTDSKEVTIGANNGVVSSLSTKKKTPNWLRNIYSTLSVGDVIWVHDDGEGEFSLRVPPTVQGSVVAMEAKTGRVLALAGGFSATYSQTEVSDEYNRAYALRQPGSTLKPFTYMVALQDGMQPNTLVRNQATYFPRVRENKSLKCKAWSPENYKPGGATYLTMRRGLETSNNRIAAQILKAIVPGDFMAGLDRVRALTKEFGIYDDPYECVSFILGSDETTLMRMVTAYAQIANGGKTVSPRLVDSASDLDSNPVELRYAAAKQLSLVDPVAIYQLRHILAGVLDRGTGVSIKDLSGVVAGKTGTSNNENDAWFVGFTNDLVIGVWVGYDSKNIHPNLGREGTGGRTALPIFAKIIRPSFEIYKPATYFRDPPSGVQFGLTQIVSGKVFGSAIEGPVQEKPERGFIYEAYRSGYLSGDYNSDSSGDTSIYGEMDQEAEPTQKKKKKKDVFNSLFGE